MYFYRQSTASTTNLINTTQNDDRVVIGHIRIFDILARLHLSSDWQFLSHIFQSALPDDKSSQPLDLICNAFFS